jgi:uroporphyrinogen-III synthase
MKVFISSELEANHSLVAASISLGFHLIQQSLLSFSAVDGLPTRPYDIVFFSSPRAYAFGQPFILPKTKVACVSIGTAKHSAHPIDWCGNSPSEPTQTALDFKQWVGERRVLFPISSRSLGSISSVFPPTQIECLTVYKTILNPRVVEACAVYIFTSPSNAEAFLLQNTIPSGAKVIAKGASTQEFLQQHGIESTYFTDESIDWEAALAPWVNP